MLTASSIVNFVFCKIILILSITLRIFSQSVSMQMNEIRLSDHIKLSALTFVSSNNGSCFRILKLLKTIFS